MKPLGYEAGALEMQSVIWFLQFLFTGVLVITRLLRFYSLLLGIYAQSTLPVPSVVSQSFCSRNWVKHVTYINCIITEFNFVIHINRYVAETSL
jgi:hypothetical protein